MPHKRNPITAERLAGLARVLRGYLVSGLEDVALWHERDISHSSVERIVLPDASHVAYYAATKMTTLIDGLQIHADRMLENLLEGSHGLVFSQPVLLALISSGLKRDAAYRIVQRDALAAHAQRRSFRAILAEDPEVSKPSVAQTRRRDRWTSRSTSPAHLRTSSTSLLPSRRYPDNDVGTCVALHERGTTASQTLWLALVTQAGHGLSARGPRQMVWEKPFRKR